MGRKESTQTNKNKKITQYLPFILIEIYEHTLTITGPYLNQWSGIFSIVDLSYFSLSKSSIVLQNVYCVTVEYALVCVILSCSIRINWPVNSLVNSWETVFYVVFLKHN